MKPRTPALSRRTLLGRAAALALPLFIPARALGLDGATAPSARITVAQIGCGGMGYADSANIVGLDEAQLVAVCDVDRPRREEFRRKQNAAYAAKLHQDGYDAIAAYHDFRELLVRTDIDAVTISTPDHWHAIIAILAAAAGKDIYCQKPLSLTIGEARAMVQAVRRHGRVLQTGSQQRSALPFRFACELVRNGRIGALREVWVRVGGPSADCTLPAEPVPDGLDWDFWLGPAPWRPFHHQIHPAGFRSFREYSGGGMTDWGAHHFDIVQWALDKDRSGPLRIEPPNGTDVRFLTYHYPDQVRVHHLPHERVDEVAWPAGARPQGDDNGITFIGDQGFIEVDRSHLRTSPDHLAHTVFAPKEVRLHRSDNHYRDWLRCIRTRRDPICDVETGARSATVCHLGNIAYWLKRPLQWDAVNERFVDDPEASRWLDRPKRAPWDLL